MLLQHSSLKEPNFERFNLLSSKRVNKCGGEGPRSGGMCRDVAQVAAFRAAA